VSLADADNRPSSSLQSPLHHLHFPLHTKFRLSNSVAITQDPTKATDSVPISDADFIAEFLAALGDGSSQLDLPDTGPLKHWQNLKPESFEKIARQCLACIYSSFFVRIYH
jgi:hypothetical protein